MRAMQIREFVKGDWSQVWPIVRNVVQAEETFPFDPSMIAAQAHDIRVEVAVDQLAGTEGRLYAVVMQLTGDHLGGCDADRRGALPATDYEPENTHRHARLPG